MRPSTIGLISTALSSSVYVRPLEKRFREAARALFPNSGPISKTPQSNFSYICSVRSHST